MFLCLLLPALAAAASVTSTWIGSSNSDWNTAGNWSNGVPNNGTDAFSGFIDVLTANPVSIASAASDTVSNLTLGTGASLQINGTLTLAGATGNANLLSNAGNISIGTAGNLVLSGNNQTVTFDGQGTLTLADTAARQGITNVSGSTGITLVNNASHTIQGYGSIDGSGGSGSGLTITNHGTISANVSGQTLLLGGPGETTNNDGILQATNGGQLDFWGDLNNAGGTVNANGGKVMIGGSFTGSATGGTFNVTNGGSLGFVGGTQDSIVVNATGGTVSVQTGGVSNGSFTLNGASTLTLGSSTEETINATIQNNSGSTINVSNLARLGGSLTNAAGGQVNITNALDESGLTLANNGDIRISGAGGEWLLHDSSFTFGGAGTVTLASSSGVQIGTTGATSLTNNDTIQGFGTIKSVTAGSMLTNQGSITANSSGNTLAVSNFVVTNTGAISATNGGTLFVQSGAITNTGAGTIFADGGIITMNANISGGAINAMNGGSIGMNNNTIDSALVTLSSGGTLKSEGHFINTSATIGGVNSTLDLAGGSTWTGGGLIDVQNGGTLQAEGGGSFAGNITIESGGKMTVSQMSLTGDTAVTDNEAITVNGTLENHPGSALTFAGAGTLTLAGGTLSNGGSSSTATITNGLGHTVTGTGTIQNGGFINDGNLNVATGAVISDQTAGTASPNTTFANYGSVTVAGQLLAGASTTMNFNSGGTVTLNGGTIGSVPGATASVVINNAGSTIEGNGTISAASFTNNGNLIVDSGSQISVKGGLTNISTLLGVQALIGGNFDVRGTLELDNAAIRINNSTLTLDGSSAKVVDQNNADALRGFSLNGASGIFSVENGASEHISPASNLANFGSIFVGGGSVFSVAGEFDQETGQTEVNGALTANSVYVAGGELTGTGVISGPVTVTSGGTIAPGDDPGTMTINGDLNEQAGGNVRIELAGASSYDQLVVNGNAQLNGTLTLILLNGFVPANDESFELLTWASTTNSIFFSNLIMPSFDGEGFTINATATGLFATFHTPEPGTWFTGIAGLAAVLFAARRRKLFG